jgi:hypothetical protein
MSLANCQTCKQELLPETGETRLSCGHKFHPQCIHSYYRGSSCCPVCPKDQTPQLDFGDNPAIASATRSLVFATPQGLASGQKARLGWITEKFKTKNSYPPLCGADELVHFKAPLMVLQERRVTATNLAESGVKLNTWLASGYTLEDLRTLGVKWSDFVIMGFGCDTLNKVPASFLVQVLDVTISNLLQLGITIEDLTRAGYTPTDLLALKCTTHTMINMGLEGHLMEGFNFSDKEWGRLAL